MWKIFWLNGLFLQKLKWTVWEQIEYDTTNDKAMFKWMRENYNSLLHKVAWFDNIITFHQVWNSIPHSKVNQVLYDANKKTFKVFKDENGKDFLVTVLMLFQTKITPQSEDKTNKAFFRIEIGDNRDFETLQKLWETLVFDCVTGNIPGLDDGEDGVTGVRFI